ncbi:hypothetical protein FHS19_001021 [Paenibacillus rhizosphaerae]|uniref:LysR substrate-binding domain-containing protein n=1 Tax=Paenibacillus rhizosphaerae TaxID=297318 RepID=A0A839TNN9_9BACL|nr:hypothetical protein [Paenibacillus rhizosphaerae]
MSLLRILRYIGLVLYHAQQVLFLYRRVFSVDQQAGTRDKGSILACQEQHGFGDFLRLAKPPHWMKGGQMCGNRFVPSLNEGRVDISRANRIDPDALGCTVVLYNDDYVKWYMDDFQSRYGPVDVLFTTNNRDLILRACMNHGAVTTGLNFSFMNEPAFRRDNIAILDFDLPDPGPVYLGVIQRKEKTHSHVSRRFMEWLKHDLQELETSMQT